MGIKLVKLHAWEDVFIRRVTNTRERELHLLYRDSIYRALMSEYGRAWEGGAVGEGRVEIREEHLFGFYFLVYGFIYSADLLFVD